MYSKSCDSVIITGLYSVLAHRPKVGNLSFGSVTFQAYVYKPSWLTGKKFKYRNVIVIQALCL